MTFAKCSGTLVFVGTSSIFRGGLLAAVLASTAAFTQFLGCVKSLPEFEGRDAATGPVRITITPVSPVPWRPATPLRAKVQAERGDFRGFVVISLAEQHGVAPARAEIGAGATEVEIELHTLPQLLASDEAIEGPITLEFDITPEGSPKTKVGLEIARAGRPGELDRSFGNNGLLVLPEIGNLRALTVLPDGTAVVTGELLLRTGATRMSVDKIGPGGALDSNFQFRPNLGLVGPSGGRTIVAQSSKYVVAGYAYVDPDGGTALGIRAPLLRIDENGAPDPGFGGDAGTGVNWTTGPAEAPQFLTHEKMIRSTDGTLVIIGTTNGPAAILRNFTSDGENIITDGGVFAGRQLIEGTTSRAWSVVASGDSFVVAGNLPSDNRMLLARVSADGALQILPLEDLSPSGGVLRDVVVSDAGTILAGGENTEGAVLVRVTGELREKLPAGDVLRVRGLALDSAGRLLVAGATKSKTFGLARYVPSGALDAFGSNRSGVAELSSTAVTSIDASEAGAQWEAVAVDGSGRVIVIGEVVTTSQPTAAGVRAVARYWD